ncbi:MAG: mechanosensitive ion channel [Polyangiales bacterium]|nr:mechanosensitive ion channel [Myxococcales bacterium]
MSPRPSRPSLPGALRGPFVLCALFVSLAVAAPAGAQRPRRRAPPAVVVDAGVTDAGPEDAGPSDGGSPPDAGEVIEAPVPGTSALEIAAAADATSATLRSLHVATMPNGTLEAGRLQLAAARAQIDDLLTSPLLAQLPSLDARTLLDVRQRWRRPEERLDDALGTVQTRRAALRAALARLEPLRTEWQGHVALLEENDVPSEVLARAQAMLGLVGTELIEVQRQATEIERLHEALSTEALRVASVMEQLDSAEVVSEAKLWDRGSPPLFHAFASNSPGLVTQAAAAMAMHWELLNAGAEGESDGFLAMLVVGVLLGLMLVYQRSRSPEWEGDPDVLRLARHVVHSPVASAALMVLMGTPLFVPTAPVIVFDIVFVALLFPVMRLLPPLLPVFMRPLLYGFVVALTFDKLVQLAPEGGSLHQTLLVIEGLVTATWLMTFRTKQRAHLKMGLDAVLLAAALLLTGVSIGAALGWEALATMVADATMGSVFMAMIMFAGALVVEALVAFSLRSRLALQFISVRRHRRMLTHRIRTGVRALAVLLWLWTSAESFRLIEPIKGVLDTLGALSIETGEIRLSLGAIVAAALILVFVGYFARFVRFVIDQEVMTRLEVGRDVSGSVSRLVGYAVVAIGVIAALSAVGIQGAQLAMLAGALSVGIGFGLQNIVSNFISGLILMVERPVKIGDFIEVGSLVGEVTSIGIRASTILGIDGAEVIMPNAELISKEVVNWTLSDRSRRVSVDVGVAYGTDPHRVSAVLADACANHATILDKPAPSILFMGFGNSSLDFRVNCWVGEYADHHKLRSDITHWVHDALYREAIEIPFPQRDLHLRSIDEGVRRALRGEPTEPAPPPSGDTDASPKASD